MSINFSIYKHNVSSWIDHQYDKFANEFQKKSSSEYEGIIKKEQLVVNNYIRSLMDEIQFEVRKDLKSKFDYQKVRDLYENYQSMTEPYNFSLMVYKRTNPKKESVFERVEVRDETSSKGQVQSTQRYVDRNVVIGAGVGGLIGASLGFKAANPIMLKMIATPTGLFLGAIVGGYIAMQLLPNSEIYKKPRQTSTMQNSYANRSSREVASTVESSEMTRSIDIELRERKNKIEKKLNEIVDQMEQNYQKLLAAANK